MALGALILPPDEYCLSKGIEGIVTSGKIENNHKQISKLLKTVLKTYSIKSSC